MERMMNDTVHVRFMTGDESGAFEDGLLKYGGAILDVHTMVERAAWAICKAFTIDGLPPTLHYNHRKAAEVAVEAALCADSEMEDQPPHVFPDGEEARHAPSETCGCNPDWLHEDLPDDPGWWQHHPLGESYRSATEGTDDAA